MDGAGVVLAVFSSSHHTLSLNGGGGLKWDGGSKMIHGFNLVLLFSLFLALGQSRVVIHLQRRLG